MHYLDFTQEHTGKDIFKNPLINVPGSSRNDHYRSYDMRIYLNIKDERLLSIFLHHYILGCIDCRLDYRMKGIENLAVDKNNDSTVLYGFTEDMAKRIRVIETVYYSLTKDNPESKEAFNSPSRACARTGSGFYGVCFSPATVVDPSAAKCTYNDYINYLALIAYARVIAKILDDCGIYYKKDAGGVGKFINFNSTDFKIPNVRTPIGVFFADDNLPRDNMYDYANKLIEAFKKRPDVAEEIDKRIRTGEYTTYFIKCLQEVHNVIQGRSKDSDLSIAFSSFMVDKLKTLEALTNRGIYRGSATLKEIETYKGKDKGF